MSSTQLCIHYFKRGKQKGEICGKTLCQNSQYCRKHTPKNTSAPNINIMSPTELNEHLRERINWAISKPPSVVKKQGITIGQQKKELQDKEKIWGNRMNGQCNNGQWSTKLGETLVFDILTLLGEHPTKVTKKEGYEPDWETDEFIYEVKTSNWWVDGTAGEKVLGTWIKYQDIPELYGKPLRIVCIANQEYELTEGKTNYFGDNISPKTKECLDLAKSWGIEYMKFSDLIKPLDICQ